MTDTNENNQDLLIPPITLSSHKYRTALDSIPKSCYMGFEPKFYKHTQTDQKE